MSTYPLLMSDVAIQNILAKTPFASGQSREAFCVPSDPAVIVKRVKNGFPGPNNLEWTIWHAVQETDLENVFGRCITISASGQYLMMEYLADCLPSEDLAFPRIPDWLTDRKRSAFGKDASGTVKVRDYAGLKLGATLESAPRVDLIFKQAR